MAYKITWEENGMLIKWTGLITASDNIMANGEFYGNNKFDTSRYQICDFSGVEFEDFTEKQIRIISELELKASNWNKNLKVVHITKDAEIIKNIKLYEKKLENSGWKFHICDTMEEARKWVES
jgi:hypothetical protein